MIEESIKTALEKRGGLDFKPLYEVMKQSGLEFKKQCLHQAFGMTTSDRVYLDIEKVKNYDDDFKYFLILHEMSHGKRIKKYGKKWMVEMLSLEDFDEFFTAVINEEMLADRYACYVFYKLTKKSFPRHLTQQLHLLERQEQYRDYIKQLFGTVNHDEEKYDSLLAKFIINN